jgi:FtsP/CotA-like multicopper oxidase with cupredoxin domain
MAKDVDVKMQNVETHKAAPATKQQKARAARRTFLRQALVASSGIALVELLPSPLVSATLQQLQCISGKALIPVGEITSTRNKLQAVLKVVNGNRTVPQSVAANQTQMLRYYKGYNLNDRRQSWPPDNSTAPGPGPTFRCSIGDDVQIVFLNQVNVGDYPASMFSGDTGSDTGCDEGKTSSDPKWYPQTTGDSFPNCFHASSAANVHFHGTHVSPSTTGDNVLVNIWPSTRVREEDVITEFRKLFERCDAGHIPQEWADFPERWRNDQMGPQRDWPNGADKGLLGRYDATQPYKGGRGLPPELRLWPVNYSTINHGEWPQYYVGSYPYCFKIPRYEGSRGSVKMGQAPGTHWYHSHKHGSTALNMFNGMSGAFIIEDNAPEGYDGKLKSFYKGNLRQQVLVFQQITAGNNLLSSGFGSGGAAPPVLVNGQFAPKITMQPGQIQLWRMINACVQRSLSIQFAVCNTGDPAPTFKQTAQDGVQLAYENYAKTTNGASAITMAAANRIDMLVKAPAKAGMYVLGTAQAPILFLEVAGTAMSMDFPTNRDDFPKMPDYLDDIGENQIRLWRKVVYGWEKGRQGAGRNASNAAPHYTIDGKQFEDGIVNQAMLLDSAEEWTIWNETSVAHPFHIHVNPFQIVEVYDPNTMTKPVRITNDMAAAQKKYGDTKTLVQGPAVWWDNFAIPIAKTVSGKVELDPNTGFAAQPGYFIMRSRFVDFTGQYVQHCHILAHEDRGMMQLLEVVPNKTTVKHH